MTDKPKLEVRYYQVYVNGRPGKRYRKIILPSFVMLRLLRLKFRVKRLFGCNDHFYVNKGFTMSKRYLPATRDLQARRLL